MPIRAVLFDLGGVVFHYDAETRWRELAALAEEAPDAVRRRFVDSGYALACDSGRLRGERALAQGVHVLGKRITHERFRNLWIRAFTPNAEVLALARAVKAHAAVALLSNNADFTRAALEARHPAELAPFLPRLFSADLGLAKPDPRAFAAAADLLGVAPAECLLVDDAPAHTDTAAALGFATHTYRTPADLHHALAAHGLV